jgi:hypothetical protein
VKEIKVVWYEGLTASGEAAAGIPVFFLFLTEQK